MSCPASTHRAAAAGAPAGVVVLRTQHNYAAATPRTAWRHGHRPAEEATYLATHATQPGVMKLPSGLQFEEPRVGSGPQPKRGAFVRLQYRGTLVSGEDVGSNGSGGAPGSQFLPIGALIPSLREAVLSMRPGAEWLVVVPRPLGRDSDSPLNRRTPIFDVTLLDSGEPAMR